MSKSVYKSRVPRDTKMRLEYTQKESIKKNTERSERKKNERNTNGVKFCVGWYCCKVLRECLYYVQNGLTDLHNTKRKRSIESTGNTLLRI